MLSWSDEQTESPMDRIGHRIIKFFAYTVASIVILLAIGVGLFRLFLPRLPEYQDEIKAWASTALGVEVQFSGMDARWGLSGPELEFYEAELVQLDGDVPVVTAQEVRIGVAFLRLLFEQSLVVDSVAIRDTVIDVEANEDGSFSIQGLSLSEFLGPGADKTEKPSNIEIIGEDIVLHLTRPGEQQPLRFSMPRTRVSVDAQRIAIDSGVRLPAALGQELTLSATRLLSDPGAQGPWNIVVEAEDLNFAGWAGLLPAGEYVSTGVGDIELAIELTDNSVSSATALVAIRGVSLKDGIPFDISTRVEVDHTESDWLLAADELVVAWPDHQWPKSSLRIEASVDQDGKVVVLDTRASYLRLDDLNKFQSLLRPDQLVSLVEAAPSGTIRNLAATVSDIDAEMPQFNVSAELERVGVAAVGERPGIRGVSGLIRADRSGGRIEIDSQNFSISIPRLLTQRVDVTAATGTVIWRNGDDRTTVLSDSIAVGSGFFQSQSNVQLILPKDDSSPEVDLESQWSISNVAVAKRYIPQRILNPRLYEWFQMALVGGSIPAGTTRLRGPLDSFPFDNGEGQFLVHGSVRNLSFKYHRAWPAAERADIEVVLDGARLYTTENRSVSAGVQVRNANVDIPDLRDPVLQIRSTSSGTLGALRDFSMQSPIADVLGGQLDRVSILGVAEFDLELTVPLKKDRIRDFDFTASIVSEDGTLAIDGLKPTLTELNGRVTITRDSVSSEGLAGKFLGDAVDIDLLNSDDPAFSVIADASGRAAASEIVDGFGRSLDGLINGATRYNARIRFPNARNVSPAPLTIEVSSELEGLVFNLPEPLFKPAEAVLPFNGAIRFMPGGETVETTGTAEGQASWQLAFGRPEGFWDLDRGVVTLGEGQSAEPASTRGLHIRGTVDAVRLEEWLSLSRSDAESVGAAERIRSIDLIIDNLYLIGQHVENHRVRVDRSARDWLVQFDGEDILGSVFVPYDFDGDRAMVLDMDKLRLPGDESDSGFDGGATLDPRKLPPIELQAAEFAFGDRYLGTVEATIEKTLNGLEAVQIKSTDDTFSIVGEGRWLVDENDALGSHSYFKASLSSNNVERTMTRLNYQPGIDSNDMSMEFDLDWSGAPRADIFEDLNGRVSVRLGSGQLEEVSPGAGRMFGLMSITALPRRLSLDFRDVFSKGFGFDSVSGSFRIDSGKTYTCDLSLDGPAADIGIVGEADLVARTYDQTAIVSANVGNTLPIVGAVVAGPQVAAALLVFSQIFKKPLQEVGQVYYGISGSWDEPDVDSTNSAAFVSSGEKSGCLPQGQ